jgi:hypothetical protein
MVLLNVDELILRTGLAPWTGVLGLLVVLSFCGFAVWRSVFVSGEPVAGLWWVVGWWRCSASFFEHLL